MKEKDSSSSDMNQNQIKNQNQNLNRSTPNLLSNQIKNNGNNTGNTGLSSENSTGIDQTFVELDDYLRGGAEQLQARKNREMNLLTKKRVHRLVPVECEITPGPGESLLARVDKKAKVKAKKAKEERDRENMGVSGGVGGSGGVVGSRESYDDDMRDLDETMDLTRNLGHSQGQGQGQGQRQGVGKNSGNHYYGKVLLACTDSVHAHDAIAILEKVRISMTLKNCLPLIRNSLFLIFFPF